MNIPSSQGIKYAGSKLKLIPYILELAQYTKSRSVLDGFSGSTRVSQVLAKEGYKVISNDIAVWSEVLATCFLKGKDGNKYQKIIRDLNKTSPVDGWFTKHYGGYPNNGISIQSDGLKKPLQIHNTRKLDGIRNKIDILQLSPVEKAVAITSLILALDKVDNTIGHFTSYLKTWSKRSYNNLFLEAPQIHVLKHKNKIFRKDIFSINDKVDLAYLDPPYGSNSKMPASRVRYNSYYHLWTTVCLNDKPKLFGKSGRRIDSSDKISSSVFEEFRKNEKTNRFIATESLEKLIRNIKANWIILSYNSNGRIDINDIIEISGKYGKIIRIIEIDYKLNVMANMKWTDKWIKDKPPNREYLFLIRK